ncbi:MAG TPA: hypothetical protein VK550_20140 [Polyangiaceae bacterium]|nr:hypothetical protein [Polyangiaceae bacterium]
MSEEGVAVKNRDWGRRAFGPARRRAIAALAEALFSSESAEGLAPAPAALAERVADEFDLLVGAGSSDLRRGFGLLAFLVEWFPIFILGELSRASRLPLARRLAYLHRLEHAKIALVATLFVAFKLPLTMIAFEVGAELGSTGFDRTTISTPRTRKLAVVAAADVDAIHEATGPGRG